MPDTQPPAYTLLSLGQFGERARPSREGLREAALVIGLGQVGLQATAAVRRMLDALLSRREFQANVRLLAIARRRLLREELALSREERLMLGMDPVAWSDVPGRYAHLGVAQWWPYSPRVREVYDDPWQVRAYNRLLLFENAALVSGTLYKLVRWLNEVGTGRDLKFERRVYLLGSLAEAEGSGMLFDIASRVRALCAQGQGSTTISAVLTLRAPLVENDPDRVLAMANVYATLREIDAYVLHPEAYRCTLPVIGYELPRQAPTPPLDMILLTDDALADSDQPPEAALAEYVVTSIAASLCPPKQAPPLPTPIRHPPGTDRFSGYTTFGVSKLALPIRAAMDLAAVGLAQAALKAVKPTHAATPTADWVKQILDGAHAALFDANLDSAVQMSSLWQNWLHDLSAAGLVRRLEAVAAHGEISRLTDLIQIEWRRLEREAVAAETLDQSGVSVTTNSLRSMLDHVLENNLRGLEAALVNSPVELAYAKGFGLIWTMSAFEELERQARLRLPEFISTHEEAQAAVKNALRSLMEIAQQVDARAGGRFSSRKPLPLAAEVEARTRELLRVQLDLILAQARHDVWLGLCDLAGSLRDQVREVIPQVDRVAQRLRDFEIACRSAMEAVSGQPPCFPAGVMLTEDWYWAGTQELGSIGQMTARDLLGRVFNAWDPGDLPPERHLTRFLSDVLTAARRALAAVFHFPDLYEFLAQYDKNGIYRQALAALPGAATPAMIPGIDDKHPAPERYEIVREVPHSASVIGPAAQGVLRGTVPSPDPDEVTMLRLLHGMMAEALPTLREAYRRAYDRAGAEGVPLHIDRRWDATMADLVHTSARREISTIWESILTTLERNPRFIAQPLDALIRAYSVALDVTETQVVHDTALDMRLVIYKLRPLRLKLPPPHCAMVFLYSLRSPKEVGEDLYRAVTAQPLEEQFVFIVNISGRADMDLIVAPLRQEAYTVLVLNEADVKHLISARLPIRALSDYVLSQVNLTTVSPFYTRSPVPEHMFFGREREIKEVRSKLRTHSVAMIGGRRIGKTSTLQRLERMFSSAESDYVPYYLDCYQINNYDRLFYAVTRRWNVSLPTPLTDPVQFEDVALALRERHPGKALVMLFDEIDSLLEFDRKPPNQETLFRTLRSLSNQKYCQYVFSGEKWLMAAMSNPYSALFNFTQAVRLEPLPPKVVYHLVADPFEMLNIWIEHSEEVIDRIYQISAGHPNIVQMICHAMVEILDEDSQQQNTNMITLDHLDRATRQRSLQEEIVGTIWGQMSPLAKLITLVWPEGERFLALSEIEDLLGQVGVTQIPPELLEQTTKELELYCFVRPQGHDQLELIPMAFPAILAIMTDKRRQVQIVLNEYRNGFSNRST